MNPETEKIIKEQIKKLPEEVRKLFTDPSLNDKFVILGTKYGLNIEQMGTFQMETMLMMLGLTHPDEYPKELKNRLRIDEEKTDNIVTDVNQEILRGIREKLKKAYEDTNDDKNDNDIAMTEELTQNPILVSVEEDKKDTQILNKAGIEFVSPNPPANGNNGKSIEGREKMLAEIEKPESIPTKETPHPILAEKLSGFVKNEVVETEHSLENLTKNSGVPIAPSATPTPKPSGYKEDPYREKPE